nr:HAD-IA family hydrolase [Giesbergeria sp.]
LLRAKGLEGFFEHVFGGDSFEKKKPDPQPLLKTCAALGTAPARTLMVGDSSNDAQAARAAGCPVVLTTYGYNHGQPVRAVDADGWVDSLVDLLA